MPDDLKLAIRQAGLAQVPDLGLSASPLDCSSGCTTGCQSCCGTGCMPGCLAGNLKGICSYFILIA